MSKQQNIALSLNLYPAMIDAVENYLKEGCGRCPLGGSPDCKVNPWVDELKLLRQIVLDCGLTEELKWSVPCYTHIGKNILLLSALKDCATVSFFKGSLLKDDHGWLVKPGPNSQATRYLKFTDVKAIPERVSEIKAYIYQAIEVEKAGLKVDFKKNPEPIPEELELIFAEDPVLKSAFEALTPGRQRGYILHFSQPKKSETRVSRIEKCAGNILNGIGLHDAYKARKK